MRDCKGMKGWERGLAFRGIGLALSFGGRVRL